MSAHKHRDTRSAMAPRRRRRLGFTLMELIIVVAVIGILATMALPALKNVPIKTTESVLKSNLHTLRNVIDQYHGDKGFYPPTLDALVEEGYLREVPRDPVARSSEMWRVVYEEIDPEELPAETDFPEDAQPGIIDVHSGSDRNSLDGTPYSEW